MNFPEYGVGKKNHFKLIMNYEKSWRPVKYRVVSYSRYKKMIKDLFINLGFFNRSCYLNKNQLYLIQQYEIKQDLLYLKNLISCIKLLFSLKAELNIALVLKHILVIGHKIKASKKLIISDIVNHKLKFMGPINNFNFNVKYSL